MNHQEAIIQGLSEVKTEIKELVRRVGIQNGRVEKGEAERSELKIKYQQIVDNNRFIIKTVDGLVKTMDKFLEKQDKKKSRLQDIKDNIFVYTVTLMIGMFLGTWLPILWMLIKRYFMTLI